MPNCLECGTTLREGAKFCPKCGRKQGSGRSASAASDAASSVAALNELADRRPSGTDLLSGVGGATTCCPDCGVPARMGTWFCASCGSCLSEQSYDQALNSDASALGVMEECPACGAQVPGSSVACSACGLTLDLVEDVNGNLFPPAPYQGEDTPDGECPEVRAPSSTPLDSVGKCIACGAPLNDDASSCPSCGLSYGTRGNGRSGGGLEQELQLSPLCPCCGIPTDAETRCCPQCGRALSIASNLD
jgi:predicted amidophosphoribosyltransferase